MGFKDIKNTKSFENIEQLESKGKSFVESNADYVESKGKKSNRTILFEDSLYERLDSYLKSPNAKYGDSKNKIINEALRQELDRLGG